MVLQCLLNTSLLIKINVVLLETVRGQLQILEIIVTIEDPHRLKFRNSIRPLWLSTVATEK